MENSLTESLVSAAVPARLTGVTNYAPKDPATRLDGNLMLVTFRTQDEPELHLFVDGSGGYHAMLLGKEVSLRDGHMSEFDTDGFTIDIEITLSVLDDDAFRNAFGGLPGEDGWDAVAAGFFNMNDALRQHLSLAQRDAGTTQMQDGSGRDARAILITASCHNEAGMMAALREEFLGCWGSFSGFPGSRVEAVVEAALISNQNPCPSHCGFQIEDFNEVAPLSDMDLESGPLLY